MSKSCSVFCVWNLSIIELIHFYPYIITSYRHATKLFIFVWLVIYSCISVGVVIFGAASHAKLQEAKYFKCILPTTCTCITLFFLSYYRLPNATAVRNFGVALPCFNNIPLFRRFLVQLAQGSFFCILHFVFMFVIKSYFRLKPPFWLLSRHIKIANFTRNMINI